jgi:hypothetical protein
VQRVENSHFDLVKKFASVGKLDVIIPAIKSHVASGAMIMMEI